MPSALASALSERYLLERELGQGGMATVYLARDLRHARPVALKVLRPELAQALGPERFLREIKLAAGLQHPHILGVLDSGEAGTQLWYTMPYVSGESLRDRLRREVQLPVPEAVRIARETALALDYAHRQGVVHRDVKPENILLSDGQALIADFGVAQGVEQAGGSRLTETGLALGTPQYMSPEQAAGGRVDGRSDQYSLACVLYEMLAGEPPFTGPTAQAIVARRLTEAPRTIASVRDGIPAPVESALRRALAKAPADRFDTTRTFAQALERYDSDPSSAVATRTVPLRFPRRALIKPGLVLGLMVLLALALLVRPDGSWQAVSPHGTSAGPLESAPVQASIAVLPLANVGRDTANEYFADGLTEELIGMLGKIPGLRVAARSSVFAFKGQAPAPAEVAQKLRVATLLEGSVRRSGTRLRVTAQLVDTRDGLTLWSDTYERELADVFVVQGDIAEAIAAALRLQLAGSGRAAAEARSQSPEAHDRYLRARYHSHKFTEPDLRRSLDLYQQVLAQAPEDARAWAGVAMVWAHLADDFVAPRESYPQAEAAALRAIEIDSTLAEAHAALGMVRWLYHWDAASAEYEFKRAIALTGNASEALMWYGRLLSDAGDLDSALAVYRRAAILDPLAPLLINDLGGILIRLGRPADAARECARALELGEASGLAQMCLGSAWLAQDNAERALRAFRQVPDFDIVKPRIAAAYVRLGRPAEARRIAEDMVRRSRLSYVRPEMIARVYVVLGDHDAAFAWLEKALQARSAGLTSLRTLPGWDPIRADPRFRALLNRIGFPP